MQNVAERKKHMAINIKAEKQAYRKFTAVGMTPYGACGLIANLEAESDGFYANRVEYLCLRRLKENGKTYSDESYTEAIDTGKLSCEQFLHPLPGKQYGYGLAQWTSPARKAGLWNLAKRKGVSVADEDMQTEYLLSELADNYPDVLKVLKTTRSIREASDIVLTKFECPADTGESMRASRASRGQKFYDTYVKTGKVMEEEETMGAWEKIEKLMSDQIGYLEKASNANLDSKAGNAGYNNYTKYARDVNGWGLMGCQGQPWCAVYQFWINVKIFGLAKALEIMGSGFYNCNSVKNHSKAKGTWHTTPKKGALVIFRNGAHIGRVMKVTDTMIYTNEGNTSSGAINSVEANGGCVAEKSYTRNYSSIDGYVWIQYGTDVEKPPKLKAGMKVKLTQDIAIRDGVSTKSQQAGYVKYTQLSASAKKKCRRLSGNKAKLKKGNVVKVKKATTAWNGSIWIQIKSGWLPVVVKGKYRVQAA